MIVKNIRHVGLTINNEKKMLDFFVKTLGFKKFKIANEDKIFMNKIHNLKKVKLKTYKLKSRNNEIIELLKFHSHKDKKKWSGKIYSTGLTHVAFTVNNLEKTYKILKKKGIKFNASPQDSPDGYAKVAFCKGPENLILELVELK
tara:strand:- start:578 stop:1012 length:435 start_codon:yes stop_codon:yes gene_type:complete